MGRLRAAQRASQGAPFGLGARPRGALGMPKIPDRTPWAPRWGPGGGEQRLWNNKMHIYSGQGFQNNKTLPVQATERNCPTVRATDTLFYSFRRPSWRRPLFGSPQGLPRTPLDAPFRPPGDLPGLFLQPPRTTTTTTTKTTTPRSGSAGSRSRRRRPTRCSPPSTGATRS